MRPRVSCPDCGLALVETPDLFGSPRLKHPDTECVPFKRQHQRPAFTPCRCLACKGWFAQKTKGYRRATCSDECLRVVREWALAKGRPMPRRKTPPATYKWAERYRKLWQKRALEMDKRWAA
jgi:hypothetical protein